MELQTRSIDSNADSRSRDACRFLLLRANDPRVLPIRQYIRDQFARHYGARLQEFMPMQLAMVHNGEIKAAAGMRIADDEALFLEHYLDRPCEQEIATYFDIAVPARHTVAEVGNLAATESGAARELFVHIAAVARREGLQWLMCNATPRVQAILRFMNLPFAPIRKADCDRVPDPAAWGSYYDKPSRVMAAPVSGIINAMLESDPFQLAVAECHARNAGRTAVPVLDPGARVVRRPVPVESSQSREPIPETSHDPN
ncbi:MAG: thermostable hemolysin [Halofilum sp. (in: g-proteobacteria)]|nr:thermostable hemolysin [Halofilum sp. (in: g-proteobacteria)]